MTGDGAGPGSGPGDGTGTGTGTGTEFRVRIKASAVEANGSVAEYADRYGAVLTFDSRDAAADLAALFSRTGGTPVAVQAAAPQDGSGVDAYLVARPARRTHDPTGSPESGLTFDVTAAQFGAIGEALVLSYEANPPLLVHYVREDLGLEADDPLDVAVENEPSPVTVAAGDGHGTMTWIPDCRAVARAGPGGPTLATYLCEIKTGGGSTQRDQLAVMQAASRRVRVLKVQLDVSDLPDSYTARVRRIEPGDGVEGTVDAGPPASTRLDEFS